MKNHGIDKNLMDKVKDFVNCHYDKYLDKSFVDSDLAKELGPKTDASEVDWESTYFLQHQPKSNIEDFPEIGAEFR